MIIIYITNVIWLVHYEKQSKNYWLLLSGYFDQLKLYYAIYCDLIFALSFLVLLSSLVSCHWERFCFFFILLCSFKMLLASVVVEASNDYTMVWHWHLSIHNLVWCMYTNANWLLFHHFLLFIFRRVVWLMITNFRLYLSFFGGSGVVAIRCNYRFFSFLSFPWARVAAPFNGKWL